MFEMDEQTLKTYRLLARKRLGDKRYEHTLAVARLAGELAEHCGVNSVSARAAGFLHDITKELPQAEQLQMIKESGILYDKSLMENPKIYHSITAAIYARKELSIEDEDILNAIRFHTTGREGMSPLEKIIYTADSVSYDRTYPNAEKLRRLAFRDLDRVMIELLFFTLNKLISAKETIAIDTVYCYNSLCSLEKG